MTYARHVISQDDVELDVENEEDLVPTETDGEALEVELKAEVQLDAADARVTAAAGIWCELRSGSAHRELGMSLRRSMEFRERESRGSGAC